MRTFTKEQLAEILQKHKMWVDGEEGGERADLSSADLRFANLRSANLRSADLSSADLSSADLSSADLRFADLSSANLRSAYLSSAYLSSADLSSAYLSSANLRSANLRSADLSSADLSSADLSSADLRFADLSSAKNLVSSINYMEAHFERTAEGYIAYKTFNSSYEAPERWAITPGSVIDEVVNECRTTMCGSGINVAPLEWVRREYPGKTIWKVLIRWEWLPGVCVPYNTDGKIRCERVELVEVVK